MPNLSYLSPKTIVQESPIHGRGLFARAPITKGEIVAIKGGYIFDGATPPHAFEPVSPRVLPAPPARGVAPAVSHPAPGMSAGLSR